MIPVRPPPRLLVAVPVEVALPLWASPLLALASPPLPTAVSWPLLEACWSPPSTLSCVLFWTGTVRTLIDLPSPPSALALLSADESADDGATAFGSPFGAPSQPQPSWGCCWLLAVLVAVASPLWALPLFAAASPPLPTAVDWSRFEAF